MYPRNAHETRAIVQEHWFSQVFDCPARQDLAHDNLRTNIPTPASKVKDMHRKDVLKTVKGLLRYDIMKNMSFSHHIRPVLQIHETSSLFHHSVLVDLSVSMMTH